MNTTAIDEVLYDDAYVPLLEIVERLCDRIGGNPLVGAPQWNSSVYHEWCRFAERVWIEGYNPSAVFVALRDGGYPKRTINGIECWSRRTGR